MKTLNYSTVTLNDIETLFNIEKNYNREKFKDWFLQKEPIPQNEKEILFKLITKHRDKINYYTELELISKVIAPILNMVDFEIKEKHIRDFYETPLKYIYKDVLFNGRCDFVVAKGYDAPIKPYFFIQEFKQSSSSYPEEQLLAEMIVATSINENNFIRGAYIIGSVWSFVILEKHPNSSYTYFISKKYDSMENEDLEQIYHNLQFVKQEISI